MGLWTRAGRWRGALVTRFGTGRRTRIDRSDRPRIIHAALDAPAPPRPRRTLPVLAFASTALGAEWVKRVRDSAEAYGGPSATVRDLPGYGHLDMLVGRRAANDVFEPARAWLLGAR